MNILFVCTGNTCRSPMAKGYMEDILNKNGQKYKVLSAGTHTVDGLNASENAIKALKLEDIDISTHKSKLIDINMIKESDIVLTMSRSHKALIIDYFPNFKDKVFTLKEFALGYEDDVIDPYGGDINVYSVTANELKELIYKLYQKISTK